MKKNLMSIIFLTLSLLAGASPNIMQGSGKFIYGDYKPFADRPVDVYYHVPRNGEQSTMPIIFVMHGADRGVDYLLKAWSAAADSLGFMVFIPQFDKQRYPLCDYQEIGIMDKDHFLVRNTDSIVPALIDRIFEKVKKTTGSLRNTYSIYGHSAGGQFVHRMMLFHDSPYVDCAVVGSPGWYTFPDTAQLYPYGVGNIPYATPDRIKKYMAKNVVVQLAPCDSIREWFLRKTPEADAQGLNRYTRGLAFWKYCRQLAAKNGWTFNWRKAEVPEVGHVSEAMGMAALPYLMDSKPVSSVEFPDTDLDGYMSLDDVEKYLQKLRETYPDEVKVDTINAKTPVLVLSRNSGLKQKAKVLIQGSLHGNEPAGAYVSCLLALRLLQGRMLDYVDVAVIPVANPDAYEMHRRMGPEGLDLNRDFTKMSHSQTIALSKAYVRFAPDVAIDLHEYNPRRKEFSKYFGHVMESAYDVLLLPTGHPNVDQGIRDLVEELYIPAMRTSLSRCLYSSGIYFTPSTLPSGEIVLNMAGGSPRSTTTRWGLANILPLFIEIKGIGLENDTFMRRVDCGLTVVDAALKTLVNNMERTMEVIHHARTCAEDGKEAVVVTWERKKKEMDVELIDRESGRDTTIRFEALDALTPALELVRSRPHSYIVKDKDGLLRSRLSAMGIDWHAVLPGTKEIVEAFVAKSVERQPKKWEGIHPLSVSVEIKKAKCKFSNDYIKVPAGQSSGNLVVTLFEPESAQGFVNFGVVPVSDGKELPIYRSIE